MDRRKAAEDNYRKKFETLGLSVRFEFIRREWSKNPDRRFWSRCRTCGAEFLRSNDIFRGKQQKLICPECGSVSDGNDVFTKTQIANDAAEYYVHGHTVKETAEKFGITRYQVNELVKARKLTNGKVFAPGSNEDTSRRKQEAEQRLIERLSGSGFEYLGGYKNKTSKIKIRCKICGFEFERRADGISDHLHCVECLKQETRERHNQQAEERKRLSEQRAEIRRIEREWNRLMRPPIDERKEALLNQTGICEICGKPYTVREYVKSCGMKYARNNGVCSNKCRKVKMNRSVRESHKRRGVQDNHRHRAKKYGCAYDPSVTLKRLVKRDGLRCAICGGLCDWNDHSWSEYSGPMYPSIDHIIPMSKRGGHVWENVQVAHIICNSEKGDSCETS